MVYRFPSKKKCIEAFGVDKGSRIRKEWDVFARKHKDEFITRSVLRQLLQTFDIILQTHGVEYIGRGHNQKSPSIHYCNTGDTYATTIMLLDNESWRIGAWGDIVERGNYD